MAALPLVELRPRLRAASIRLLKDHYYLIDLTRGRYDYPTLRGTAIALAQKYEPHYVLIEDASTGTALSQELNQVYFGGLVHLVSVEHDKVGRLYVNQGKFAAGLVLFRRNAPFMTALEAELLTFPQCKTDDQVDSISQALSKALSVQEEKVTRP